MSEQDKPPNPHPVVLGKTCPKCQKEPVTFATETTFVTYYSCATCLHLWSERRGWRRRRWTTTRADRLVSTASPTPLQPSGRRYWNSGGSSTQDHLHRLHRQVSDRSPLASTNTRSSQPQRGHCGVGTRCLRRSGFSLSRTGSWSAFWTPCACVYGS